jgi:hypothetical protein
MDGAVITQHDVDVTREITEGLATEQRLERRTSVANFWKVICGTCTIIGILSGFLLSDLRFMGIITETKTRVDSLQSQINSDKIELCKKIDDLRTQAQANYEANHTLIQKVYDLHTIAGAK